MNVSRLCDSVFVVPTGHPHIAQARPPPEGPGLPWVARTKRYTALKGQPKLQRAPKDKAGGTPAVRRKPAGRGSVPQASRRSFLFPGAQISDALSGHVSGGTSSPGQAWPFGRRPGLGYRERRIMPQRGSRNCSGHPKTRQAGRLRCEEDLRGAVPYRRRPACRVFFPARKFRMPFQGKKCFGTCNPGQAWPFGRRPGLGYMRMSRWDNKDRIA